MDCTSGGMRSLFRAGTEIHGEAGAGASDQAAMNRWPARRAPTAINRWYRRRCSVCWPKVRCACFAMRSRPTEDLRAWWRHPNRSASSVMQKINSRAVLPTGLSPSEPVLHATIRMAGTFPECCGLQTRKCVWDATRICVRGSRMQNSGTSPLSPGASIAILRMCRTSGTC